MIGCAPMKYKVSYVITNYDNTTAAFFGFLRGMTLFFKFLRKNAITAHKDGFHVP